MGDRANVVVYDPTSDAHSHEAVFLYGHWSGYGLPETLKAALVRGKPRWQDSPYLARIVFDEMTNGAKDLTGFGISTRLTDNEYPLLVLDVPRQVVVEYPQKTYEAHGFAQLSEFVSVPFAAYSGVWSRETANVDD